jgi:hypothetical protein
MVVVVVVVVVFVGIELESGVHTALHGGEPWHPFTWFAQKKLVQSVHEI